MIIVNNTAIIQDIYAENTVCVYKARILPVLSEMQGDFWLVKGFKQYRCKRAASKYRCKGKFYRYNAKFTVATLNFTVAPLNFTVATVFLLLQRYIIVIVATVKN